MKKFAAKKFSPKRNSQTIYDQVRVAFHGGKERHHDDWKVIMPELCEKLIDHSARKVNKVCLNDADVFYLFTDDVCEFGKFVDA